MYEWIDPFDGQRVAERIRERADWLRSEYLRGGSYEYLSAREQEARMIAYRIERNMF